VSWAAGRGFSCTTWTGARIFLHHLDLGPNGTLDINATEPGGLDLPLDQELDSLVGSGSIVDANTILLTKGGLLSPGGADQAGWITIQTDPATGSFETSFGSGPGQEDGLTYRFESVWEGPGSGDVGQDGVEVRGGTVYLGDYWTLELGGNEPPRPSDELTVFEYDWLGGADLSRVRIDAGTTGWDVSSAQLVDDFAGRIYLTGVNQAKANELDLTWVSGTDGLWSTPTRWDGLPATAPTGLTTAVKRLGSTARVVTAGQRAHRLLIEEGTVEVSAGGSLTVSTNVDISGGGLSVLPGGTFSAGAVNLSGTGRFSIQQDVTVEHFTATGPDAVINTGGRELKVTSQLLTENLTFSVTDGAGGFQGANLVDTIDRLTLYGGTARLSYVAISPTEAALSYYSLDDPADPGHDDSEHGHDLTLRNGPTSRAGIMGQALRFLGGGQDATDPDAGNYLNGLSEVTFAMWIKSDATGIDRGFWECRDSGGSDTWGMRYDAAGADGGGTNLIKLGITTTASGGNANRRQDRYESANDVQTTEWQHLAMTWKDGEGVKLYINGELDQPTFPMQNTQGLTDMVDRFTIGDGSKNYWAGLIDEVFIFGQALSQAEVQALYQSAQKGYYVTPRDLSNTQVRVTAPSELILETNNAVLGNLELGADLSLTATNASFAGATITVPAVSFGSEQSVLLTRESGLSAGGSDVALTKTGAGELVLSRPGDLGPGSTISISGGTLTLGAGGAAGQAAMELAGGNLLLTSIGSPASLVYDHAVTVMNDAEIAAGKTSAAPSDDGPQSVSLGSPGKTLAVLPGRTLMIAARDQYELTIAGQLAASGAHVETDGPVSLGSGGRVGELVAQSGPLDAQGNELAVERSLQLGELTFSYSDGDAFTIRGNDLFDSGQNRVVTLGGGNLAIENVRGRVLTHYSLDSNPSHPDPAVDDSGNGHDLTLRNGPTPEAGRFGEALRFVGSSQQDGIDPDAGNYLNGLPEVTIALWVKSDAIGVDRGIWECRDSGGADTWGLRYDNVGATAGGDDVIKVGITTTASGGNSNRVEDQQESKELVQTTDWQHLAITWIRLGPLPGRDQRPDGRQPVDHLAAG